MIHFPAKRKRGQIYWQADQCWKSLAMQKWLLSHDWVVFTIGMNGRPLHKEISPTGTRVSKRPRYRFRNNRLIHTLTLQAFHAYATWIMLSLASFGSL